MPEGGKVVWPGDGLPEVEDMQDFVLLCMQGVLEPMGIKDRVSGFDDSDSDDDVDAAAALSPAAVLAGVGKAAASGV